MQILIQTPIPFFSTTWGWGNEKIEKKKTTTPEELWLIFIEP